MKATPETSMLWRVATARMPTKWGMFHALGFKREITSGVPGVETALAIVMGDLSEDAPLLRLHSQCFTGEALGSLRCDCGDQLAMALQAVADEGRGVVIYEYQEGRGIGLMAKLQAYELQDAGIDTVEANRALGFKADYRDFSLPVAILRDLRVRRVRLLTNNPHKVHALTDAGIEVVARIPCEAASTSHFVGLPADQEGKNGPRAEPSTEPRGERQVRLVRQRLQPNRRRSRRALGIDLQL